MLFRSQGSRPTGQSWEYTGRSLCSVWYIELSSNSGSSESYIHRFYNTLKSSYRYANNVSDASGGRGTFDQVVSVYHTARIQSYSMCRNHSLTGLDSATPYSFTMLTSGLCTALKVEFIESRPESKFRIVVTHRKKKHTAEISREAEPSWTGYMLVVSTQGSFSTHGV